MSTRFGMPGIDLLMKNPMISFINSLVLKILKVRFSKFTKGSFDASSGQIPLSEPNFILRGCSLQNTESVIGIVAYTGYIFE